MSADVDEEDDPDTAMRRLLMILFSAAPFVVGAIAALSARHDLRMLWMAVAVTVVARLVFAVRPAKAGRLTTVAVAFAAATAAASGVAVASGARAVFGVVAVAVVLAGSATLGAVFDQPRVREVV